MSSDLSDTEDLYVGDWVYAWPALQLQGRDRIEASASIGVLPALICALTPDQSAWPEPQASWKALARRTPPALPGTVGYRESG